MLILNVIIILKNSTEKTNMPREENIRNDNLIIGRNPVMELLKSGREIENIMKRTMTTKLIFKEKMFLIIFLQSINVNI